MMLKIFSRLRVVIHLSFAMVYGTDSFCDCLSKKQYYFTTASKTISSESPKIELSEILNTYNFTFKPHTNLTNLLEYSNSEDYKRHAKTARIYYNSTQLTGSDALRIIFQREPTNIAMGANQHNEENLEKLFGYKKGVYNDLDAKKMDGSSFKELSNSATVYSETYLWNPPGGKK